MDYSPILISMKTAGLAILVTFFIGIALARFVVGIKNCCCETYPGRIVYFAAGSSAHRGRDFFSALHMWCETAAG